MLGLLCVVLENGAARTEFILRHSCTIMSHIILGLFCVVLENGAAHTEFILSTIMSHMLGLFSVVQVNDAAIHSSNLWYSKHY
jgi:hypothetical protein